MSNISSSSTLPTKSSFWLDILDIISFLVLVSGIVFTVRFFIFNPFTIIGQSMEPQFHEHDFIIIDKVTPKKLLVQNFISQYISSWTADIIISHYPRLERGDVIVFVPQSKNKPYIKRIIGLSGELVRIQSGQVTICTNTLATDCRILDEPYLATGQQTTANCGKDTFIVSDGYLAMGDNRDHSTDSRCCFGFGCYSGSNYLVHDADIIGKVLVRLYPDFRIF